MKNEKNITGKVEMIIPKIIPYIIYIRGEGI